MFRQNGLAPLSLGMVATISLKADEPGLQEFATRHGVPVRCFGADELARVTTIPTPSEKVRSKIGVAGVAEPAAMLAANTSFLIVSKVRSPNATMAVARREDV
jgi:cobalamin biosynthesis protein CbiG